LTNPTSLNPSMQKSAGLLNGRFINKWQLFSDSL
jgi:hypothetical protein